MTNPDSTPISRSYKLCFYPNSLQQKQLAIEFGCARWVWNTCLAWCIRKYRVHCQHASSIDFSRELTFLKQRGTYAWLKEASATVLSQKLRDQESAFRNFFAGRAKYPRFKKRAHTQSIRCQLDQRQVAGMYRAGEFLKLPKLGPLKLTWSRVPGGIPKRVTLTKDCAGRYFISFMCEETIQLMPRKPNGIGVDLGVHDVVVTSDGWKSGNPRHLKAHGRQLRKEQRRLARKVKGSHRRHTQRASVAQAFAKVKDCRQDWLHKLSTFLVGCAGFLSMEDLNIKGMMGNRKIAKSIGDVGMFELKGQLEYKSKWYGVEFTQVDRWAPTNKTCSTCGTVQEVMPLQVREWGCPDLPHSPDRDSNATKNILMLAPLGRRESDARGGVHPPEAVAV